MDVFRILQSLIYVMTICLLAFPCAAVESDASDQADDLDRSLTLECGASGFVSVAKTASTVGLLPAGKKIFKEYSYKTEGEKFLVKRSQLAECIYPGGGSVRVKVGEDRGNGHGMCGADNEVFFSVWINKRKIESMQWFSGHCHDDWKVPAPVFHAGFSSGSSIHLEKCAVSLEGDKEKPISACIKYPDISRYPVDRIEYPAPGAPVYEVGAINVVQGKGALCDAARRAWLQGGDDETNTVMSTPEFSMQPWQETTTRLDTSGVYVMGQADFDFDNDGVKERVFMIYSDSGYMSGSALVVSGSASGAAPLELRSLSLNKAWIFPCQYAVPSASARDCPPFSQKHDGAGLSVAGVDAGDEALSIRYIDADSFSFGGSNYMTIHGRVMAFHEYLLVLKPLPGKRYERSCLLEKRHGNF
jgi:hypothetical protein